MTQQDAKEKMGERENTKGRDGDPRPVLEDLRVPTQIKLAGLWATVMFMYIYVDIIGFFSPGLIEDILVGKVWVFDITQTWMLTSVMLMTIPAVMVFLSLVLPAKANRYANIMLGILHIFMAIGTALGEVNAYYVFGSAVEALLLASVVWTAWKWPVLPKQSTEKSHAGLTTG